MSTDCIPVLSARLARLAVEVDELAQQILAEPLSEPDELFLAAPIAHLAIALEWLEQALYECERLDLTHSWARWLRDARNEPDHARTEDRGDLSRGNPCEPAGAPEDVLAALDA